MLKRFFILVCIGYFAQTVQAVWAAVLENPPLGSFQSGIGLISGWVCNANQILIQFDGGQTIEAAFGTSREDTRSVCGDANNGFGLLFNWNLLGDGEHTVRVLADGMEIGSATVNVTTFGQEFIRGARGRFLLEGFPEFGKEVLVEWQENNQNFTIAGTEPTEQFLKLDGTYKISRFSIHDADDSIVDSEQPEVSVSGTMIIDNNNITRNITMSIGGSSFSTSLSGTFVDNNHFLRINDPSGTTSNTVVIHRGNQLILENPPISHFDDDSVIIEQWIRVSDSVSAQTGNIDSALQ